MHRLTLLVICSVVGSFMVGEESHAQMVRIYGGRADVRAPFVRIYAAPAGGTVFQTPFGAVRSTEHRPAQFNQPAAAEELPPPPALDPQSSASNRDRQRSQLAASAQQLAVSLQRFANGAQWHRYLKLSQQTAPSSDAEMPALNTALERLESVRSNPQYRELAGLPGFEATYRDLSAYLTIDRHAVSRVPTPRDDMQELLTRMAK